MTDTKPSPSSTRLKVEEISSLLNFAATMPGPIGNNMALVHQAQVMLKPATPSI